MKKIFLVGLILPLLMCVSCKDDYYYDDELPPNFGQSIYDELAARGGFTTYIRLIEDLDYKEVLSKTGSKTLFVADDEAFNRFYANNSWGVSSYDDLTLSQKKYLLNSAMLDNAILIEGLSTQGQVKGQIIRRATSLSVFDTETFEEGDDLPSNAYWERFRSKGIYLLKDASAAPMLFLTNEFIRAKGITNQDFSILENNAEKSNKDIYVYNVRVREENQNIVCLNGYIHILDEVLVPPSSMAEEIRKTPELSLFSKILERFSAPYPVAFANNGVDTLFAKGYFAERSYVVPTRYIIDGNSGVTTTAIMDPNNKSAANYLAFDPGWNTYSASSTISFQLDMGAIFAPTNDALNQYFNEGSGKVLIDRYGSIDNIPDEVLVKMVRNVMKPSFLGAIPSVFPSIVDDSQELIGINVGDVQKTMLTSNGVVYVTDKVYVPSLYSSVMFPTVINENMKVIRWAIDKLEFDAYLLSMVNTYSFIIPKDNFTYVWPNTLAPSRTPLAMKFHFDDTKNSVYASVHNYDVTTQTTGDSLYAITTESILLNHLEDMLDYHIVVSDNASANIQDGKIFYQTKGGGFIRVEPNQSDHLILSGGGDIERGITVPVAPEDIYDQTKATNGKGNGMVYVVPEPLQTPTKSVYAILSDHEKYPQFSKFFELLQGNDDLWTTNETAAKKYSIFYKDLSQAGMDLNVRFLNTFHYTLYVPTNEAVERAISAGLPTWEDVERETDIEQRFVLAEKIIKFLRYHFQDNAILLDVNTTSGQYETAALNEVDKTFYKLTLTGGNNSLTITTKSQNGANAVHVKTDNPDSYNIMARDFKFNTANPATSTTIETSSYVVIHQIDDCLYYE